MEVKLFTFNSEQWKLKRTKIILFCYIEHNHWEILTYYYTETLFVLGTGLAGKLATDVEEMNYKR